MNVLPRINLGITLLLLGTLVPAPASADHWLPNCPHHGPHSHTYGAGGSAGARSDTVTGGDEFGAGVVTVFETNVVDCDEDFPPSVMVCTVRPCCPGSADSFVMCCKGPGGTWQPCCPTALSCPEPADYDGDWDTGVGGGFFGYGPWAHEPTCNYALTTHGATVTVNDLVYGSNVAFVIGADDTSGPVVSTDPVTGETTCETDGSITPGDPTTDPIADADDCLSDVYVGSGTTCGAGGDGGYWVFLSGLLVTEGAGGAGVYNTPTTGTITA